MHNFLFWVNFKLAELRDREDGATAVEYGLMVGLIAVVILLAVQFLGTELNTFFQGVGNCLASPSASTCNV